MSRENVEIVCSSWEGLERRDVRLDLCDEQVELKPSPKSRSATSITATMECGNGRPTSRKF